MASKRRQRRRSCENKIRHPTLEAATAIVSKLRYRIGVYKCRFCNGYHLGRAAKRHRLGMERERLSKY